MTPKVADSMHAMHVSLPYLWGLLVIWSYSFISNHLTLGLTVWFKATLPYYLTTLRTYTSLQHKVP